MLEHLHAERFARSFDAAIQSGDRNCQTPCKLKVNYVIALHMKALTEINDCRRIEFERQSLNPECAKRSLCPAEFLPPKSFCPAVPR